MQDLSILVGIPCLDSIKTETFTSLFSASNQLNCPTRLDIHKSCYVHDSRNKIVAKAIELGVSHLMFIDSDMQFPADGINRLLAQDKDIIGAVYYRRQTPHHPTLNVKVGDDLKIPRNFPKDKPFKVWGIGTGFLLIKTKVLKEIKSPWFFFGNYKNKMLGEDYYFCMKAHNQGFDVWADPTIPVGHVGEYIYDIKDYQAYDDIRPKEDKVEEFTGDL